MEGFDYESSDGGIEILDDFTGYENSENAAASSSTMTSAGSSALKNLDTEIAAIDDQIASLRQLRSVLQKERQSLLQQASSEQARQTLPLAKKKKSAEILLDYTKPPEPFEWASQLKKTMEKVWGITSFRLCQEGVCNANMDGRDILCVMPTGGGKSLCYQLPALLSPGTTIIISPLLSLIADQVLNLREAGVECVMLTGTTSKQEQNEAFARMTTKPGPGGRGKEIKLCYVTPEKVAKSKRLISAMEQLATSGRLARIVIDEAHCCSALGHDFRPDYKRLSVLKSLFPKVPILAVTATLSQKVLPDLLKILKLPPLCDGRAANARGTCAFSAPLYRKNLHYKVLPKATNAKVAIQEMADWIREHHPGESGIVYCLSKKDTEVVAQGLMEASQGSIKTGVYHADVADAAKERIHRDWKRGKLQSVYIPGPGITIY